MSEKDKTIPRVFILESLDFNDEKKEHFEGEIISKILGLSNIDHEYQYFRTEREFDYYLQEFSRSKYRYLHISCHGKDNSISTTFDEIDLRTLVLKLENILDKKRLFLSACSITNEDFASRLFDTSDCYSLIGCDKPVNFNDSAIFWAAFYHRMFNREKNTYIRHSEIKNLLESLLQIFNIPLKFFHTSSTSKYKDILLNHTMQLK